MSVESDEYQHNSGKDFEQAVQDEAHDIAEMRMSDVKAVCEGSDYTDFFAQLADVLSATSNEERLDRLTVMRDQIHTNIANSLEVQRLARQIVENDDE